MTYLGQIKPYKILSTRHADERMEQRGVDWRQALGAILSLGIDRLREYETGDRDVLVRDTVNGFTAVFTVDRKQIRIITVIDNVDCHTRENELEVSVS